jgi:hypothetical protein
MDVLFIKQVVVIFYDKFRIVGNKKPIFHKIIMSNNLRYTKKPPAVQTGGLTLETN